MVSEWKQKSRLGLLPYAFELGWETSHGCSMVHLCFLFACVRVSVKLTKNKKIPCHYDEHYLKDYFSLHCTCTFTLHWDSCFSCARSTCTGAGELLLMTMSVLPTPNLQLRRVCTNSLMIYRAELHCKLNRWLMIMICFVGKRAFTFIAPLGASETPTRKDNRALLWCNIQKLIKANKASPHKFYLRQLDLTSCQVLCPYSLES